MFRRLFAPASLFLSLLLVGSASHAQSTAFDRVTGASSLPNGIDLRDGQARMQITALRDDVLRIRISRTGELAEDASWAVLETARHSRTAVTAENTENTAGFATRDLRISIELNTGKLTIRDRQGNVLQQDARPVEFEGDTFRFYKTMPMDEHYFGLGDKTGPLDRRNEAFTLWNTDAYRFQESTDPLYKSIPYFMAFRAGRTIGVLLDNTWRTSFDFGKESPKEYSFGSAGGPIDYYVFYGPRPKQV